MPFTLHRAEDILEDLMCARVASAVVNVIIANEEAKTKSHSNAQTSRGDKFQLKCDLSVGNPLDAMRCQNVPRTVEQLAARRFD